MPTFSVGGFDVETRAIMAAQKARKRGKNPKKAASAVLASRPPVTFNPSKATIANLVIPPRRQPEVKVAIASGLKAVVARLAVKAVVKSPLGPIIGRALGRTATVGGIAASPFSLATKAALGVGAAATFVGGAVAEEFVVEQLRKAPIIGPFIPGGGDSSMGSPRGAGQSLATLPGVGGTLPPGETVVKVWDTGTAKFARLADGRIAVQKKDGTIKTYRPQKHIVIPRNPRVGTLIRADKRLKRLVKGLKKVVK